MFYKRAFDFEGRSTRAEYWWVILFYLIAYVLFFIFIAVGAGLAEGLGAGSSVGSIFAVIGVVGLLLFWLIGIIPHIALAWRRFQDMDQPGFLSVVFLVVNLLLPTIIVQWIWFCFPGTHGSNQYGEDPFDDFIDVFE